MKNVTVQKGFTLIELLVTIVIITTLAVAVFVALNPAQRLKDARDARRTSDIDSILSAVHQSIVDNKGSYATNMPAAGQERQLGSGNSTVCATAITTGGCNTPASIACADLMLGAINVSKYLKTMPVDPLGGTTYDATKTGYSITQDTNGIVTVRACATGTGTTEGATNIFVSR